MDHREECLLGRGGSFKNTYKRKKIVGKRLLGSDKLSSKNGLSFEKNLSLGKSFVGKSKAYLQ